MGILPKKTKRVIPYQNKYVELIVDTLRYGKRKVVEYAFLERPNKKAVGIAAITKQGVYLVRQYRHPVNRYLWQIVLGVVEKGDGPLQSARKELLEEAGIIAGKISKIGTIMADPGLTSQTTFIYRAENLEYVKNKPEMTEIGMKVRFFSFEEVKEMIHSGKIQCGYTISTIYLLGAKN